ncbi:hypothetical protein E4U32_005743 [Claviceps aff. humidiphila group G2b]|nr:hypothetical protein E4U32_005743 [Claviceps aff. humidiphila group G2b]
MRIDTNRHGLAARRRETRSSSHFQLGVLCCLFLCVLLPSVSRMSSRLIAGYRREETRPSLLVRAVSNPALLLDDTLTTTTSTTLTPTTSLTMTKMRTTTTTTTTTTTCVDESSTNSAYSIDRGQQQQQQQQQHQQQSPPPTMPTLPLRLITQNIRFAANHTARSPGEHPWPIRCPKLCTQLHFLSASHNSPFLCLQEVLHAQLLDIQAHLGPHWSYIGRGRGPHETDEEYSPIFYRVDTWTCRRSETRWLSETPDRPSKGWDAALNRIVTMGLFEHRETGVRVVVMSTHFDHRGTEARMRSARLLVRFAGEWSKAEGDEDEDEDEEDKEDDEEKMVAGARLKPPPPSAVLVAGDFNSQPGEEAYRTMTAPGTGMVDLSEMVPEGRRYGNYVTYTSFGEVGEVPLRIDFLFVREGMGVEVETFGVLGNSFDDLVRVSDHRPVVSDLRVRVRVHG